MATANFTSGGNGGINVIETDELTDINDTLRNIYDELGDKGYTLSDSREFSGRDTIDATEVYFDNKLVAVLHVTAGYYEHANIEIYMVAGMTAEQMVDEFEELVSDYDSDRGWYVDRKLFTRDKRHAKRVQSAVETYTTKVVQTAKFSNGETWYEKV